ncbi:PTS IIA-like nitrogen regulatory protein PtsN [Bowmanella sp. Y26]|uniref:PTS IIA-like nitrogen regulatory protein PtsN n=1 Tax=Bowmanella yangjiangensis TaxID=2811230 RepID=A0ABS3CVB6_9ALTE|nr:PTS IIA-like nitrogen regulatory protein PtsN [Bowmanella yangjiangensis]MBN7821061.1 PTS IIA-like nitrogen regulatory protein PtsN [Bowmanella yangjiangensis]MBT1062036.1 PTS IIA-like nitrogen regulatory protein PtsN [Bowmanella yangjiangensis]
MEIKDILTPDRTVCAVQGSSKKRILESISDIAAQHLPDIGQDAILTSLLNREKMGSTGIGCGIAIPHGRLAGLSNVTAILVTSQPGVAFEAIDNQPVDIFFAILVPEDQAQGHLQTLATIAAKLNDKETVKKLRHAQSNQELFEAIV